MPCNPVALCLHLSSGCSSKSFTLTSLSFLTKITKELRAAVTHLLKHQHPDPVVADSHLIQRRRAQRDQTWLTILTYRKTPFFSSVGLNWIPAIWHLYRFIHMYIFTVLCKQFSIYCICIYGGCVWLITVHCFCKWSDMQWIHMWRCSPPIKPPTCFCWHISSAWTISPPILHSIHQCSTGQPFSASCTPPPLAAYTTDYK